MISFEEYCKSRGIDVNLLDEDQYEDINMDYFFDVESKTKEE